MTTNDPQQAMQGARARELRQQLLTLELKMSKRQITWGCNTLKGFGFGLFFTALFVGANSDHIRMALGVLMFIIGIISFALGTVLKGFHDYIQANKYLEDLKTEGAINTISGHQAS